MAIPDYQSIMLPLLEAIGSTDTVYRYRDIVENISEYFELSDNERNEKLPSGKQTIIHNRVGWAKTYLKKAGLLDYPKRGYLQISEKGLNVLKEKPDRINVEYLEQFPEFLEFREKRNSAEEVTEDEQVYSEDVTPDELLEKGFNIIKSTLADELMEKLLTNSPAFFEEVVLKLLTNMGYGEGEVTGRSGDEGIDGFINQDRLGIDKIFFQAKRFKPDNPVTASMVRDFVGSLDLKGVSKGVFITTSRFPKDTEAIIEKSPKRIVLINGSRLKNLLIDYNVGVTVEKVYEIKRLDSDFFPEE